MVVLRGEGPRPVNVSDKYRRVSTADGGWEEDREISQGDTVCGTDPKRKVEDNQTVHCLVEVM